jgi:hypothetical protein
MSAAEVKYMRKTAGYNGTDYRTNCKGIRYNLSFWTKCRTTEEAGYNTYKECLLTVYGR